MSILTIKHKSLILDQERNITIVGNLEQNNLKSAKIMFFLHGLGGDNTTVLENSNILQHAIKYNFIIIFPNADRSFYSNTTYAARYYDYISQEVPNFIEKIFNFNFSYENMYLAGISMGGYGALKILFSNSYKFKHAISFSGSLDIATRDKQKRENIGKIGLEWKSIFGSSLDKKHDLFILSSLCDNKNNLKINLYIGESDYLLEGNLKLFDHLKTLGYNVFLQKTKGQHNNDTFSKEIDMFFNSLN